MKEVQEMKKGLAVLGVFILTIGFAVIAGAQQQTYSFKMQSTWTAGDFHHQNPTKFVEIVEKASGGRIKINLMAAGAVVPAFEVLDAVNKGILDMGNSWPGYWFGKHPAATLFGSVAGGPFGMDSWDFMGWYYLGGGKELYNDLIQKELKMGVVAFASSGETCEPQGWFRKPIKTVKDFKGIKFRAGGMASEVYKTLGMTVVILPGGEIVPAMQRGVIDAAEYSEPSSDMSMGFQDVAKYYYLPGMHQPTGMMEIIINKSKWDPLPADLKAVIEFASMATQTWWDAAIKLQNAKDLETLVNKHNVKVYETPREILVEVLKAWDKVAEKHSKANAFFDKVYQSQREYAKRIVPYKRLNEPPYELAADYYWKQANPYKVQKP
jgi:TRAP-type mannitol/chloroaromatic compound transport system substrate-binding protein